MYNSCLPQADMRILQGTPGQVSSVFQGARETISGSLEQEDHVTLLPGAGSAIEHHELQKPPAGLKPPDMEVTHCHARTFDAVHVRDSAGPLGFSQMSARIERDELGDGSLVVTDRNLAGAASIAIDLGLVAPDSAGELGFLLGHDLSVCKDVTVYRSASQPEPKITLSNGLQHIDYQMVGGRLVAEYSQTEQPQGAWAGANLGYALDSALLRPKT